MSVYAPCEKCGLLTEQGLSEPQICNRCDQNAETFSPEQSLLDVENPSEIQKVYHKHLGECEIDHISQNVAVKTGKGGVYYVAKGCLEVVE